jgi:hypothetical protein
VFDDNAGIETFNSAIRAAIDNPPPAHDTRLFNILARIVLMPKFPAFDTQAIHKLFMLGGVVATAATLYLAWTLLNRIEPQAMDVLRQQILAELDLRSFHQQLQSLEAEERQAAAEYSPQQLEILRADMQVMQKETRAATEKLGQISLKRSELTANIKITLMVTLIVLSASLMLIIFGFIGWYFRIRILEEPEP